jgi:hypothetical protein
VATAARRDPGDRLLVAAGIVLVMALAAYVVAFVPVVEGDASHSCQSRDMDYSWWPPQGSCGEGAPRGFDWEWPKVAVPLLLGAAAIAALLALATRRP